MFNNNTIETTQYGILSGKIHGTLRIAHLSDLHEKQFGEKNKKLFRKVEQLVPDVIAITGDLIAHENQKSAPRDYARTLARGLTRIAPVFFVTGNHEFWFDELVTDALTEGGVTVVRGGLHTLTIRGMRVNISGMDDVSYKNTDVEAASGIFRNVAEGFNVFLTHRPEVFPALVQKNIDLVLAGHTHAGQIRIPGISRLYMQGQGFFPKYMQGEFTDGDTTMIISRGLGASGYPTLRINNPPDLVAVYVGTGQ